MLTDDGHLERMFQSDTPFTISWTEKDPELCSLISALLKDRRSSGRLPRSAYAVLNRHLPLPLRIEQGDDILPFASSIAPRLQYTICQQGQDSHLHYLEVPQWLYLLEGELDWYAAFLSYLLGSAPTSDALWAA